MKVLYISSIENYKEDGSVRYRCYNFSNSLINDFKIYSEVIHDSQISPHHLREFDIFIFHRPYFSRKLEDFLKLLSKNGKHYYADYDDLIFDKDNIKETSLYKNYNLNYNQVLGIVTSFQNAFKLFKNIFVSTSSLKKRILQIEPTNKVILLKNSLDSLWLEIAKDSKSHGLPKRIGYFCGSQTHNLDFKTIEDELACFLNKNTDVKLRVVGPLEISDKINPKQIERVNKVPYLDMVPLIAECSVTIAPLDMNLFNNCKSRVKFLESLSVGVPCIASPIRDMKLAKGIVLAEEGEWVNLLEKSIYDSSFKKSKLRLFKKNIKSFKASYETQKLVDLFSKLKIVPFKEDKPSKKEHTEHLGRKVKAIGPLIKNVGLSFDIVAKHNGLSSVSLYVATYQRNNLGPLKITILNTKTNKKLYDKKIIKEDLSDNSWITLPVLDDKSKDVIYKVTIEEYSYKTEEAITFYVDPSIKDAFYYRGKLKVAGCICTKLTYLL